MFFVLRQIFLLNVSFIISILIGFSNPVIAENSKISLNVYKDANCGCCNDWLRHVDERGFISKGHNIAKLSEFKLSKGIAPSYQSCHTAVSAEGYVFEGHVPARYVLNFLSSPPANAIGLSVPAMPMGSPGMEYQNKFEPYEVLLLMEDGSSKIFAQVNSLEESVQ
jgi:hypothetical protein